MDPLYVALGSTMATVGTMACMYLWLFKVVLPRAIAQGMAQAGDVLTKSTDYAMDRFRKEKSLAMKEMRILAAELFLEADERLNRIDKITKSLPFTKQRGGGGMLGKLGRSLGIDLNEVAGEVLSNPEMLAQILPGGSSPSPGAPTPTSTRTFNFG